MKQVQSKTKEKVCWILGLQVLEEQTKEALPELKMEVGLVEMMKDLL